MPWSREFDTPVPGFATIGDAAEYITKLPKKEQDQAHWQFAVDMLMKANKHDAYILFAGMAMGKALSHGKPEKSKEPRRKRAKKYRVVT